MSTIHNNLMRLAPNAGISKSTSRAVQPTGLKSVYQTRFGKPTNTHVRLRVMTSLGASKPKPVTLVPAPAPPRVLTDEEKQKLEEEKRKGARILACYIASTKQK